MLFPGNCIQGRLLALQQYPGRGWGDDLYFRRRGLSYHAVYAIYDLSHGSYLFLDHAMVSLVRCEVKDAGEELWSAHCSVPRCDHHRVHIIK